MPRTSWKAITGPYGGIDSLAFTPLNANVVTWLGGRGMDYVRFYAALFASPEAAIGPIDKNTIFAIMSFDSGGPLNFSTIGADRSA